METAVATGIEQAKIMELLRGAGTCGVAFFTDEEFVYMSLERYGLQHSLVVGEHGGRDINGVVKSSQLRLAMKRGKRDAPVSFEHADDGIAVRIDGEVRWTLTVTGHAASTEPFKFIGDHEATIPLDAVKEGSRITWVCDGSECRYSLGAVRYEKGYAISTDGRRMNTIETGLDWDVLATVPATMVDFAAKFGSEVSRHRFKSDDESSTEYLIAGELICEFSGRFPEWGRVLPENTERPIKLDATAMLRACEDHIDTHDSDDLGFSMVAGEFAFTVNAKYLAEIIRKMKLKTIEVQASYTNTEADEDRSANPILITSDDAPDWQCVLMPMSKNR